MIGISFQLASKNEKLLVYVSGIWSQARVSNSAVAFKKSAAFIMPFCCDFSFHLSLFSLSHLPWTTVVAMK
jgi:hypothetical protein